MDINDLIFEFCLDLKSIAWVILEFIIKTNKQIEHVFKIIKKNIENLQFE